MKQGLGEARTSSSRFYDGDAMQKYNSSEIKYLLRRKVLLLKELNLCVNDGTAYNKQYNMVFNLLSRASF
jgi:hypothetical protein